MYDTYTEYADLKVLKKDWGVDERVDALERKLDGDWWCTMRRTIPYSPHSDSCLVELFVVVKKPYGWENFKAEANGKLLYVGQGRRRELVYTPGQAAGRRFVLVDSPPVKAFYLRHKGDGYRAFRYLAELQYAKETRNKLDVQQYLQEHMSEVHPAFTRQYFARLVDLIKADRENDQTSLRESLLAEFRRPIAAFRRLQALEAEERSKLSQARRESQASALASFVAQPPQPCSQPSFVPPPEPAPAEQETPFAGRLTPPPQAGLPAGHCSPDILDFGKAAGPTAAEDLRARSPPLHAQRPASVPQQQAGGGGGGGSGGGGAASWIDFDAQPAPSDKKKEDVLKSFVPVAE